MKLRIFLYFLCHFFIGNALFAQVNLTYNGWLDTEFTKAGEHSHFYYNGIHKEKQDWRLKINQVNTLFKLKFSDKISLNSRFLLEQNLDRKLDNFLIANLNLTWKINKKWTAKIGRFNIPYGQFSNQQHPKKRVFANIPTFYSYYVNISDKIGYVEAMGEGNKVKVDSMVQWGSTGIYYTGYTTGILLDWEQKKDKIKWSIGLTNGALNLNQSFQNPVNLGVVTKLSLQPTYFWKQGVSIAYGTFLSNNSEYDRLSKQTRFQQILIGTDYNFGFGFFEISGELNAAFYKTPQFLATEGVFLTDLENNPKMQSLNSFSSYTDLKYEMPFLSGFYLAYRIDLLYFNKITDANNNVLNWDNNVSFHSFGVGYNITDWLLFRSSYTVGNVKTKSWNLSVFRTTLTVHI